MEDEVLVGGLGQVPSAHLPVDHLRKEHQSHISLFSIGATRENLVLDGLEDAGGGGGRMDEPHAHAPVRVRQREAADDVRARSVPERDARPNVRLVSGSKHTNPLKPNSWMFQRDTQVGFRILT